MAYQFSIVSIVSFMYKVNAVIVMLCIHVLVCIILKYNCFNSSESDRLNALFFFSIANVNSVGEHGWVSTLLCTLVMM